MLFVTPPLYVLVTDLMLLSQWKGLWCSWALYSSSTLIAVYFYSTYYIQSATGCSNVWCIAGDCRCDDVCFVPLSLPDWCPAFQPFHGHPFLYISPFPLTNHQPLIIIQNVLLWGRRQKVARTWLHCVKPVIGGIVWKVRWQLDLKQAITWNPTTSLMAALSSPLYQLPPSPLLSSPNLSLVISAAGRTAPCLSTIPPALLQPHWSWRRAGKVGQLALLYKVNVVYSAKLP